ncbi:hypothetical protein [Gorillibacterium massiliense]|uniref:hypothetical protein n=1 Tax=Gorillibacterium massiliense TaxID=1280390 RepID=UPI0004B698AD|nr:hypothetical protein [Gorillibacterium massiliense]
MNGDETSKTEPIETAIRLLPVHPLPKGFVEEAMARWRKARAGLPAPLPPSPLRLQDKLKIVCAQGLWKEALLGILFFLLGYFLLSGREVLPPLLILPVIGCIPYLVCVAGTARQSLCGMGELTRSLRIPLHWYLQARLLLMGLLAVLMNTAASFRFFPAEDSGMLLRVALLWCIPLFVNAGAALFAATRIRSFGQLAVMLALLPVFWLILLSMNVVIAWAASVGLVWLWGLAGAGALVLGGALAMNSRDITRGGVLLGA